MSALLTDVKLWLELDGDATDSSSNGNDFTDGGGMSYTTGKLGNALDGDATNSLTRSITAGGDFTIGNKDYAINFWVRWALAGQTQSNIISFANTDLNIKHIFSGTERIQIEVNKTGGGFTRVQVTSLATNTWYNVHYDYNATTQDARIRVNDNDSIQNIVNVGATTLDRTTVMHVGGHDIQFHGDIDNVIVRSGSLWTDEQITELYNSGNGVAFSDLVAGATGALKKKLTVASLRLGLR